MSKYMVWGSDHLGQWSSTSGARKHLSGKAKTSYGVREIDKKIISL
jgi:hypothetical protein